MNKLFIFDCFGVIFSPISVKWFNNHYPKDIADERCKSIMDGVDMGDRSFDVVMEMISKDLNIPPQEVKKDWINSCKINYELLEKIKELKKYGKTALLSNAPSGLIETIFKENHLKIEHYFDLVLISADHHMMKPDLKFYRLCIDSFNEKFDWLTMVDDRMINLKNVTELNIEPILMTNNKEVMAILDNVKLR